jgi:hypothetical protein
MCERRETLNQSTQTTTTSSQKFPVSDFLYDCVTLMHAKLQGIEALNKYEQDAQQGGHDRFVQLIQKIRQQDTDCVNELRQILASNINNG